MPAVVAFATFAFALLIARSSAAFGARFEACNLFEIADCADGPGTRESVNRSVVETAAGQFALDVRDHIARHTGRARRLGFGRRIRFARLRLFKAGKIALDRRGLARPRQRADRCIFGFIGSAGSALAPEDRRRMRPRLQEQRVDQDRAGCQHCDRDAGCITIAPAQPT